jgi:hypothetical protein
MVELLFPVTLRQDMRDGLVDLPSLGQAAGVRHVTKPLGSVTLLHIFIVTWFGKPVNP